MYRTGLLLIFTFFTLTLLAQQTRLSGRVIDAETGETMPGVRVNFQNSKIGTFTDSVGNFVLESYYATESVLFYMAGYEVKVYSVNRDQVQVLNVRMTVQVDEIETVYIR